MIMRIFDQQIHVAEEFSRHLQNLLEKETIRESSHDSVTELAESDNGRQKFNRRESNLPGLRDTQQWKRDH